MDQQKRLKFLQFCLLLIILSIVTRKLIDLKILETLAKCKEKIAQSTEGLAWAKFLAKGGQTVHLVLALPLTKDERSNIKNAGGKSQKLKLFIRGNAMSGALTIKGINQFLNPLIVTGITKKKIITKA